MVGPLSRKARQVDLLHFCFCGLVPSGVSSCPANPSQHLFLSLFLCFHCLTSSLFPSLFQHSFPAFSRAQCFKNDGSLIERSWLVPLRRLAMVLADICIIGRNSLVSHTSPPYLSYKMKRVCQPSLESSLCCTVNLTPSSSSAVWKNVLCGCGLKMYLIMKF